MALMPKVVHAMSVAEEIDRIESKTGTAAATMKTTTQKIVAQTTHEPQDLIVFEVAS